MPPSVALMFCKNGIVWDIFERSHIRSGFFSLLHQLWPFHVKLLFIGFASAADLIFMFSILIFIDLHRFSLIVFDFHWFSMIFIDLLWFSLIVFDFHRFSLILGPGCRTSCGGLWRRADNPHTKWKYLTFSFWLSHRRVLNQVFFNLIWQMCNLGRISFPPRNVDCSLARPIISNLNKMYIKTY